MTVISQYVKPFNCVPKKSSGSFLEWYLQNVFTNHTIYIYNFFFFFFHHTTCYNLSSSAANQGDNTVSIAQGDTAIPGTAKQLLPLDRVFKKIYIYIYARSTKTDITLDVKCVYKSYIYNDLALNNQQ